ncbi:MAG: hemolysin XhlA family protein [Clostridiales bacterium]|nr:hemolysin XhlA family protein [Clostridiales bacterium]MCD7801749.1 hemolysin XhlA family protein [Clostridiales bacterium]MCD7803078.1 hemolysin XhlA family protein [Clostridiales bacterium]
MSETIIASLISGIVALAVCMINNAFQQSAQRKQADKTTALITYRLEELEKKVGKHNEVIERTYKLEQHEAVMDEQIKVANHRIEDLEQAKK